MSLNRWWIPAAALCLGFAVVGCASAPAPDNRDEIHEHAEEAMEDLDRQVEKNEDR